MGKPNNLRELIEEIFYISDDKIYFKLKINENISNYMTEGLRDWIINILKD